MSHFEDFVVTCGNCGGKSLEHQITACEHCKKDVCLNCAGCVWEGGGCCDQHPADCHKGECWTAINGEEADHVKDLSTEHADLLYALDESVKLQSHYATLLNQYDGGQRKPFDSGAAWLDRLKEMGKIGAEVPGHGIGGAHLV